MNLEDAATDAQSACSILFDVVGGDIFEPFLDGFWIVGERTNRGSSRTATNRLICGKKIVWSIRTTIRRPNSDTLLLGKL